MILLDTNAILWILAGEQRVEPLLDLGDPLFISPVSLLEIHYLVEVGRVRESPGHSVGDLSEDPQWQLDSPPSDLLFLASLDLTWTRDPFDRLLAAHALCRRWRLATGDELLSEHLPPDRILIL